jgi:hypothetical protein
MAQGVRLTDEDVRRALDATETLAKYGIHARWSPSALRVAVVARLPKSDDRKRFNALADGCTTRSELVELAAATLEAFQRRQTSLRPPPPGEDLNALESEPPRSHRAPYLVK